MLNLNFVILLLAITCSKVGAAYFHTKSFTCGPYGFICDGYSKLRLCDEDNLLGPPFLCPPNTLCNEDSSDVCETTMNYIDPGIRKTVRCHRNERIADPSVPDCKGYILCIPNKNRFQGINFKCAGNTVFNGNTRSCTTAEKYKCPVSNTSRTNIELYINDNRSVDSVKDRTATRESRPIECKNYKFSVTNDDGPVRATYFCPSRPVQGETSVRCTVFSSKYCLTLERDNEDQYSQNVLAYRKPRGS